MSEEIWKAVPGYEGLYEASTHGRIKSLDRYVQTKAKNGVWSKRFTNGCIKKLQKHTEGYLAVMLQRDPFLVHQVIALTFIGECPADLEIAHFDGCKHNNHISNLRYDSPKGNHEDRLRHGTSGKGEKNAVAKLTEKQVLEIRELDGSQSRRDIADNFGIAVATVWKIVNRTRWNHI